MRHSKLDLTMNVYTDPRLLDVRGALDVLPALPLTAGPTEKRDEVEASRAEDGTTRTLAPTLALTSDKSVQAVSFAVRSAESEAGRSGTRLSP
jgi:hypothetical protein